MISVDLSQLEVRIVDDSTEFYSFTSGNESIDRILRLFSKIYQREGKASTNLFYLGDELVGFCTVLADKVSEGRPLTHFPDGDFIYHYPSVQLYALGVQREYQSEGIGSEIIRWILGKVDESRDWQGIRFLTARVYNDEELLRFYRNNFFERWDGIEISDDEELIPMVYDFL